MKVRLGDYIKEYSKKNKADEKIPVYSVTNTQGFCQDYFGKEVASKDKTTYKIVPRGYFAYNPSRINVGSVDWQRNEERVIVSPLYNVFSVSKELDQEYLYYYLKSDFALQRIRVVATGSVRDNLKLEMLKEFPILLPPKDIQKAIANNLDRVKRIIALRKIEIEKLDELIKARFVEMFGDIKINEYGWKKCTFKDVSTKITDGEHGTVPRVDEGEGYLYFMARNITKEGEIDLSETSFVPPEIHEKIYKRCNPEKDDLLLVCVGATIGKCTLVSEIMGEFSMARSVALIKPNKEMVTSNFLINLLRSEAIQNDIDHCSHAAAQAGLYTNMINSLEAFVPPMDLQIEFDTFCEQVDKSKVAVQKALDETKLLFDSLMQQYFG